MPVKLKLICLILPMLAVLAQPVLAETAERPAPSGGVLSLLPPPQTTNHSITLAGRKLDYQAKAATLSLLSGKGDVTAEIFYVAYTLEPPASGAKDQQRPITFVFNGGPGAASAYLHIGALGPRIIATGADGEFLPSPQRLIDNPDSWLDMTDLVFVDPVGTGYSREAPGQDTRDFWGVNQDASSIGAFIRLYLAQNGRTGSPLFLAGESYGGFRAALLARTLQEDIGISPNGIVLISPALEFTLVQPDEFEPLHWALELPSLAAVRLRAEGVSGDALREKLADVEHYAMGDYLTAITSGLEQGRRLASQRVADITGLPLDLVQRNSARIPTGLFAREFARASGKVLSPYDATIGTADIAPESA
ncbi:peptidase S10, partial [Mesorhizobium sp. M7A.F.Ca.CA.002.09.1.1]